MPSWSSDGGLAFSLGGRVYAANADGSGRSPVGRGYAPAWRPRSADIAYLTTVGARNTDLWVSGALWARDAIGKPAWSSDGKRIAYTADRQVWVVPTDGSSPPQPVSARFSIAPRRAGPATGRSWRTPAATPCG